MLTSLLSKLNPYIMYVKVAAIAALVAGSMWITHEWDRRGYEAAQVTAVEKQVKANVAAMAAYKATVAAQSVIDEDVSRAQRDTLARLSTMVGKLNGELKYAKLDKGTDSKGQPVDLGRYAFNGEFVRLYNSPIITVNGSVPADPANSIGTPWADQTVTNITRDDFLRHHAELVTVCGEYKSRLDKIDAWDKRTFKEK